jgi:hypothetical protein
MARAPKKKVVLIPNGERFTLNLIGALFATVGVVILFVLGKAIHGYLRACPKTRGPFRSGPVGC